MIFSESPLRMPASSPPALIKFTPAFTQDPLTSNSNSSQDFTKLCSKSEPFSSRSFDDGDSNEICLNRHSKTSLTENRFLNNNTVTNCDDRIKSSIENQMMSAECGKESVNHQQSALFLKEQCRKPQNTKPDNKLIKRIQEVKVARPIQEVKVSRPIQEVKVDEDPDDLDTVLDLDGDSVEKKHRRNRTTFTTFQVRQPGLLKPKSNII